MIGRYVARAFVLATLLTLAVLVVLVVAVNLMENAGRITNLESQGALTALRLSLFGSVEYAYQVLPIACLFGALIAGTLLARRGELLAMQACGLDTTTLRLAFAAVALAQALIGMACAEWLLPEAMRRVEDIERHQLHGRVDKLTRFFSKRSNWVRYGDTVLYLPQIDADGRGFTGPVLYRLREGAIREVMEAGRMRYLVEPEAETGRWQLQDVWRYSVDEASAAYSATAPLDFAVEPRALTDVAGNPRQMPTAEIVALIARRRQAGFDVTAHRIELHSRFAYPLLSLWLTLLVLPWALNPDRRRSLAVTLGGGVVVVALFLTVNQTLRMLALSHTLSAPLGAWGSAIVTALLVPCSELLFRRYRVRGGLL